MVVFIFNEGITFFHDDIGLAELAEKLFKITVIVVVWVLSYKEFGAFTS